MSKHWQLISILSISFYSCKTQQKAASSPKHKNGVAAIRGDSGCRSFIDAKDNASPLRTLYPEGWIMGYFSGLNSFVNNGKEDVAEGATSEEIISTVLDTCRSHPEWGLYQAIERIAQ